MDRRWKQMGDVDWMDYGTTFYRRTGKRVWQYIVFTNMDEACGKENEGQSRYNVSLREVDLDALSPETIRSAQDSCGFDRHVGDEALALACNEYGAHAPMGEYNGSNARKLLREAHADANALVRSTKARREALNRPVNALGFTAAEYMRGDVDAAIQRGCEAGNPAARIVAKMYGVDQSVIDDTRPADFLPFVMGYMAGKADAAQETGVLGVVTGEGGLAPEYIRGYERGERVRKGECPAPSWIKG